MRRLAAHPKIRRLLQAAYGRRPFAFQTLNFRRGSQQNLHSDTVHFNTEPQGFMAGVWIALEDVRPEAGPLIYKRGSHRLPVCNMQDLGVAAGKSLSSVDLVADPQLWERGLYREVLDAEGQSRNIVGPSWKMSREAQITDAAPRLGQHNAYVFGELLGLSAERQRELSEAGITR